MSKDIIDLLSTESQKKIWERLIAVCKRYSKGQGVILAYQMLKKSFDFDVDIYPCMEMFNNPLITVKSTYEQNVIEALAKHADLTYGQFLARKKELSAQQQQKLITNFYAQSFYDAKKPALLAIFKECMDKKVFPDIAAMALLLRQKKRSDMTDEERTIFEVLYGPEGDALFYPYLKQNESDVCKNAFGEYAPLYAYPSRKPLDILAGRYYVQINDVFYQILRELQGAYRDTVFNNPKIIREQWAYIIDNIPLLTDKIQRTIGPIPDILLSKESSAHFPPDVLMHFIIEIKPFINSCRDIALTTLREALIFDDLEAICISIQTIQLELLTIRKEILLNDQDVFAMAKRSYVLVSTEFKLAKKALKLYPEVGRLLLGYVTRNFAYVIDYLVTLRLDKETFFKVYPEFEQVFFWQFIFSMEPLMRAQIHYGLLQVACCQVKLSDKGVAAKSTHYKTELRLSDFSHLIFFSIGSGDAYLPEQLEKHYQRGLNEARLRKLKLESRHQQCGESLLFGGGRLPSC